MIYGLYIWIFLVMNMASLIRLISPFDLLFFVIVAGFIIGRIRIKGVSLGISGVLFVAMLTGFIIDLLGPTGVNEIIASTKSTLKTFSKLGTSIFVSVIGLQTGLSIKNNSKNSIISFLIGAIMSISGVIAMLLISVFDKTINYSYLLGILCGALTCTPGLSSVCELIKSKSELAVLGYSCSYFPGVILVVFITQILASKRIDKEKATQKQHYIKSKTYPELILICITALFGNIIGNFKILSLDLSLGSTACTLMFGLLVGFVFRKSCKQNTISDQCLNAFKSLGLAMFFAGTGFSTGLGNITFDIRSILYGTIITLTSSICGLSLCKLMKRKHALHEEFIIAGGMTSSPAYGVIAPYAGESSANSFSFSYFGALISIILAMQFICN